MARIQTYTELVELARSPGALVTPAEVALVMRVDPKTVNRWANAGKIRSVRTGGGHRRLFADDVIALVEREGPVVQAVA